MTHPWKTRLLGTTRGRIIQLLRPGSRTVDELAAALELSGTSVRAHLARLESEGLVRHTARRGGGKPTYVYSVVPEMEIRFHRTYDPLLAELLVLLRERMSRSEIHGLMRAAGVRLAAGQSMPVGDLRVRVEAAKDILTEMGGVIEVEEVRSDHGLVIHGLACPLAALTAEHAVVCTAAQSMLQTLLGVPIAERCDRGNGHDRPHCRFEIAVGEPSARQSGSRAARRNAKRTRQ